MNSVSFVVVEGVGVGVGVGVGGSVLVTLTSATVEETLVVLVIVVMVDGSSVVMLTKYSSKNCGVIVSVEASETFLSSDLNITVSIDVGSVGITVVALVTVSVVRGGSLKITVHTSLHFSLLLQLSSVPQDKKFVHGVRSWYRWGGLQFPLMYVCKAITLLLQIRGPPLLY